MRPPRLLGLRLALLGVYLLALGFLALWPIPVDRPFAEDLRTVVRQLKKSGIKWISVTGVEFVANVLVFLVLAVLIALVLPRALRWLTAFICVAGSLGVEVAQFLLLPDRHATWLDVQANSIGGVAGTALVLVVMALRPRSSRRH